MRRVHIPNGIRGVVKHVVIDADSAIAQRSGDVAVLATPRIIALVEEACVRSLSEHLTESQTSVGVRVQVDHVQPTPIGCSVVAEAVLEKSEGRRLTFHVKVEDERGMVATGFVTRVVVDRERFLHKLL